VVFAVMAFAYPVIKRLLLEYARPRRMAMIATAEELLSSDKITEEERDIINDMLTEAFDWRPMFWAMIMYPVVFVQVVMNIGGIRDKNNGILNSQRCGEFCDLHHVVTAAANPVAALVFHIEVAVSFALLAFFTGIRLLPILRTTTIIKATTHHEPNNGAEISVA
jgi:hypothetical protein